MGIFRLLEISAFVLLLALLVSAEETPTCEELDIRSDVYAYDAWNVWPYSGWHNMTFWGGHLQIPTTGTLDFNCFTSSRDTLVVLKENHPARVAFEDTVVEVEACSLNRNNTCEWTMKVEMRKCNSDLLYRFPWGNSSYAESRNQYICFNRIYTETCSDKTTQYSSGTVDGNILSFYYGDIQNGWFDGFINGKQYISPSLLDIEMLSKEYSENVFIFYLQDPLPETIAETPVRVTWCDVYYPTNGQYYEYIISDDDNGNCYYFIYVRACNGRIQFDFSMVQLSYEHLYLIYKSNIFVNPEIKHNVNIVEIEGKQTKEYSPELRYRCSFAKAENTEYITNWYLNGTFVVQKGPSTSVDDLVLNDDFLNNFRPGYEVQCGVISTTDVQSNESFSEVYYAGWKVSDTSITFRKSGYAFVELEPTIPYGCSYTDNETQECTETLSAIEPSYTPDVCAGSIIVQDAEHPSYSNIQVQTLKAGEAWSGKKYKLKFSTLDENYDDKTETDLELSLTRTTNHRQTLAVRNEIVGAVHISVTDFDKHWNKKCYSHVDPHHRTTDGQYFEMQRPGDHMLYLNQAYQTEIQQAARYCTPGYDEGPVCACGIAIRVGADVFVINRCHDTDSSFEFDYRKCDDGGIIDIEKISDFRYMVTTPTGTKVDIFLLSWYNTMNIDIYMSAKDVGNVIGLCGYFDGNKTNDLRHRDNATVSYDENRSYLFSDSWKLTEEENLFKNKDRILDPWNPENAGGPGNACSRPRSITQKKCKLPQRKKRSLKTRRETKTKNKHQTMFSLHRSKRSAVNYTTDEAREFCNQSVYTTPAVKEFSDKLADEDLDVVVQQCVYDLTHGNDTAWAKAHTVSLNNAADTILNLNPVFVANNSEAVKLFLSETCLDNCSQNGICLETGICECNGVFRGPDCSFDIRIPPVIYEVHGGDVCDPSDGGDCTCFQMRTENVFEGFMCDLRKYRVFFNGTKVLENNKTFEGDYYDIFTGVCCDQEERKKRSTNGNDISVTMHVFYVSNDGTNYGDPNTVYIYDTLCIEQNEINGIITFVLKDEYCYINEKCERYKSRVLSTDECLICNPTVNPYKWTKGNCEESEDPRLQTSMLVGIIIGSFLAVIAAAVLVHFLCLKWTKGHRKIQDSHSNLRTSLASINHPQLSKSVDTRKDEIPTTDGSTNNDVDLATYLPDISFKRVAKPLCKRNMLATQQPPNLERPQEATDFKNKAFDKMEERNGQNITSISVKSFELY